VDAIISQNLFTTLYSCSMLGMFSEVLLRAESNSNGLSKDVDVGVVTVPMKGAEVSAETTVHNVLVVELRYSLQKSFYF